MNPDATSTSAPSNSADDWLAIAVRRGYLSAEQSAELVQEAIRSGWAVHQLAVDRGLVTPVERDIIEVLVDPEQVAPGYLVLDVIGYGGLGVVYKAQQINLDRPVALKTVLVTRMNTSGALARFQQETKTIGALRHPNIVTAFDSGTHAGRLFLVMEIVEGVDLARTIQHEKRLDEFHGLWIARQIAGGLAHAAERNIVHRDIKPANILITKTPQGYPLPPGVPLAKITDFGLALLSTENDDTRLTLAGTTMGTPHYMAPEQLRGSTVDLRADIFALGATLYHLLAGIAPFAGSTFTEIVANRARGTRRHIKSVADHLSEPTIRLVEEMMAEDPMDRPADYAQLMARIDQAIQGAKPSASLGQAGPFMAPRLDGVVAECVRETGMDPVSTRTMVSIPTNPAQASPTVSAPPVESSAIATKRAGWSKRVALLAITLLGVTAGESPAPTSNGREVPLFDGSTLTGWEPRFRGSWGQGRDSEGGFVLQGRATSAQAASIVRDLPAQSGRPLENFRVQLGMDARDAQRVEILFGDDRAAAGVDATSRQGAYVLLVERDSARIGAFDNQSRFQPTGTARDLSLKANQDGPAYRTVRIDYYAGQWRVYVDDTFIGALPAPSRRGKFWIGLVVGQGSANFENLQFIELAATVTSGGK